MCEGHQPSGARLLSDARSWSALPASRRAGRLRGRGAGGRRNSRARAGRAGSDRHHRNRTEPASIAQCRSTPPTSRRDGRLRGRVAGGYRSSQQASHTAGAGQGVQGESGAAASPCRTQDRRACISAPSFRVACGSCLLRGSPDALRCRDECRGSGSDATRAGAPLARCISGESDEIFAQPPSPALRCNASRPLAPGSGRLVTPPLRRLARSAVVDRASDSVWQWAAPRALPRTRGGPQKLTDGWRSLLEVGQDSSA